jgi:hypothetical protein
MHAAASLAILAALQTASTIAPKPAPPVFVTSNYGLTFKTPPGSFYCPLPDDWVGSDHGTVVFLASPGVCGGAGYASSSRNFLGDVPRIEIYYGYWFGDEERSPPCNTAGTAKLLSEAHPLCREDKDARVNIRVWTRYMADSSAEVVVTLVTEPGRLHRDMATLITLTNSMRTCSFVWTEHGKKLATGKGPRCPQEGTHF